MPGGRGGRRKGTPGQGYSNRTDLAVNYAPTAPQPVTPPAAAFPGEKPAEPAMIYPEDIPKLDDPTGRPHEPVMSGITNTGPSDDPTMAELRAAYAANPTRQLAAVIRLNEQRFGLR